MVDCIGSQGPLLLLQDTQTSCQEQGLRAGLLPPGCARQSQCCHPCDIPSSLLLCENCSGADQIHPVQSRKSRPTMSDPSDCLFSLMKPLPPGGEDLQLHLLGSNSQNGQLNSLTGKEGDFRKKHGRWLGLSQSHPPSPTALTAPSQCTRLTTPSPSGFPSRGADTHSQAFLGKTKPLACPITAEPSTWHHGAEHTLPCCCRGWHCIDIGGCLQLVLGCFSFYNKIVVEGRGRVWSTVSKGAGIRISGFYSQLYPNLAIRL